MHIVCIRAERSFQETDTTVKNSLTGALTELQLTDRTHTGIRTCVSDAHQAAIITCDQCSL